MFDHSIHRFQLNPNYRLQYEEAQQCHVLLYPEGLVKLSDTAVEILKRCASPISAQELIAQLQRDYPDAETLADDVMGFLHDAQSHDWIVAAGE